MVKKAIILTAFALVAVMGFSDSAFIQAQTMEIDIMPVNPPIIFGWWGGWFEFHGRIINNTDEGIWFDQWVRVIFPIGLVYEPIWENSHRTWLGPSDTLLCLSLEQHIPGCVEEGEYLYTHFVGQFDFQNPENSIRYDSSSFNYYFAYSGISGARCNDRFILKGCFTEDQAIPFKPYAINQNFPNPFNIHTAINYTLNSPGHVRLDIYDMLGRKVRTLVDEFNNAGPHQVIWNGINSNGETVSTGIYFYRLSGDDFAEAKRMTLIK